MCVCALARARACVCVRERGRECVGVCVCACLCLCLCVSSAVYSSLMWHSRIEPRTAVLVFVGSNPGRVNIHIACIFSSSFEITTDVCWTVYLNLCLHRQRRPW